MKETNQCDGCARGLPLTKDGIHKGEDYDLIVCTKDRYKETTAENWHKQALELSEIDELTETINNGKYVEAHIVKELIISTVIKTKEEVLRDLLTMRDEMQEDIFDTQRFVDYIRFQGINLEEPSK